MNAKTAKLIHKFSLVIKQPAKRVKRFWNKTPRIFRAELRLAMRRDCDDTPEA